MKFKVGDRVKVIKNIDSWDTVGLFGNIIEIYEDGQYQCKVKHDQTYSTNRDTRTYRYENLALVSPVNTSKIVITSDGNTTLARLYDGNKVIKSAEAKCSPDDTYDFATGASLAYDRLMRPTTTPVQDKPKYKVGDKAKIIQNTSHHGFNNGEIVKIHSNPRKLSLDWCWVCTQEDGKERFNPNVYECDIEPYTEPAKEPAEPVKLYCVKDFHRSYSLKKGKIYTIDSDGKCLMDGEPDQGDRYTSFEDFKSRNPNYAACLVPLVKCHAKVGEYVLRGGAGRPLKVERACTFDPSCAVIDGGVHCKDYLVLDGYTEEPAKEEPKYYSGKVVCVEAHDWFTVGKLYAFKDGRVKDDDGSMRPMSSWQASSLSAWNERHGATHARFIEYKGEQA